MASVISFKAWFTFVSSLDLLLLVAAIDFQWPFMLYDQDRRPLVIRGFKIVKSYNFFHDRYRFSLAALQQLLLFLFWIPKLIAFVMPLWNNFVYNFSRLMDKLVGQMIYFIASSDDIRPFRNSGFSLQVELSFSWRWPLFPDRRQKKWPHPYYWCAGTGYRLRSQPRLQ